MRKQLVLAGVTILALTWCAASLADDNVKIIQGPPSSVLSTPPAPSTNQQQSCCHDGQYLRQGSIVVEPTVVYPARSDNHWHDGNNDAHDHGHHGHHRPDHNRPHQHKDRGPG